MEVPFCITPLLDAPPLLPRETALSYVSRMAAYYGCRTAAQFCDDFAISLPKLMDGDAASLAQLALLTGSDLGELARWSAKTLPGNYRSINSQLVDGQKASRRSWSFCAECAEEDIQNNPNLPADIAIYARAEWQTSFIRTCERHQCRLRSYSVAKRSAVTDLGNFIAKFMIELGAQPSEPATAGPMEAYLLDRLLGRARDPVPLLDGLNLSQVVSICRSLGATIEGDTVPFIEMSQKRLEALETRGFDAFLNGETGLLSACREIRDRHWSKADRNGCLHRIAMTYQKLRRDPAIRPVAEAIAKAAFATFPFAAGEGQLGVICEEPILMRSDGARLKLGIGIPIWRLFLKAKPSWIVFDDGDPSRTLVDIAAARAYFAGKLPFTSLRSFAQEQGIPYRDVEVLKKAGVLQRALFPEVKDPKPFYSLPQLRAAVQSTGTPASAANDNQVPDGFVSLSVLCRAHPVDLVKMRQLVHSGALPHVESSAGKKPNDQIFVELKSALAVSFGIEEPIDINEVASRLRSHVQTVRLLTHTGTLPAASRPWRGGTYHVYAAPEVEAFSTKYIFPTEMAERGIPITSVRPVAKVVHPTWRTSAVLLYLRSDAERAA